MGRKVGLSGEEKGRILELREFNFSIRQIAKKLKRSQCVISSFLKDPEHYGTRKSTGRPKKLSSRDRRLLGREASKGLLTVKQLKQRFDLKVSCSTVLRCLHSCGFLRYKKRVRTTAFKKSHMKFRLQWAQTKLTSLMDWGKVIFSDEKKFSLDGPDGCQRYWHDIRRKKQTFVKRVQGGGSVMVWGGISSRGRTEIVILNGRQTSVDYIKVLGNHLLPFGHMVHGNNFVFQQDNAPIHTSKVTRQFFHGKKLQVMDWPACSPDLNPIENVWGILSGIVYKNGKQYFSKEELKIGIKDAWRKIDKTCVNNVINSMTRRCEQVIKRKGGITSY